MKRLSLLSILLIISILTLVFVAYIQRETNTISIYDPNVVKASIIMLVILFFPPMLLSFFDGRISRMISFYYQILFLLGFLILSPIGLFSFKGIPVTICAILGCIVSVKSLSITKPSKK